MTSILVLSPQAAERRRMNMEKLKYLIIGGGVAGTTAAETVRQKDPTGSVAIISDEPYRLYSRIMLSKPNFFLEKIPFEQIWLKSDAWYKENKIDFLGGKKAAALEPSKKILRLDDNTELGYEKLLLATGACPRPWKTVGSDKSGIFYLRTLDDGKAIIKAIKSAKRAVTIGGGFISFEISDLLRQAGIDVALIIRESHYWEPILDETSGRMIEKALEKGGVKIIRNSEVQEVLGDKAVKGVILKDGTEIPCEMIVCGIGVVCSVDWLKESGIKSNRGILANEYLETNLPDVWVAGDAAEFNDLILEEVVQLGNWVNAQEQGRIAGLNMTGSKEPFKFVSFYTTQGFGISIAFVGDVRPGESLPRKAEGETARKIITRGSSDINSYAQLIVMGEELIGATLINRTQELGLITKLIENNIDVSMKDKELSDPNFDLNLLLNGK